jgi:hypothetical protein
MQEGKEKNESRDSDRQHRKRAEELRQVPLSEDEDALAHVAEGVIDGVHAGDLTPGDDSGRCGWWTLKVEFEGELEDADREHIGEMIKQGNTSGQIVSGKKDKTGWWELKIEEWKNESRVNESKRVDRSRPEDLHHEPTPSPAQMKRWSGIRWKNFGVPGVGSKTEGKDNSMAGKVLTETWRGRLQDTYEDYDEFAAYAEIYSLHTRLGYKTPQAAWDANPVVQGSVNPADYKKVKESLMLDESLLSTGAVSAALGDHRMLSSGAFVLTPDGNAYSYSTLIGSYVGSKYWVSNKRYSVTTSKHQGVLRQAAADVIGGANLVIADTPPMEMPEEVPVAAGVEEAKVNEFDSSEPEQVGTASVGLKESPGEDYDVESRDGEFVLSLAFLSTPDGIMLELDGLNDRWQEVDSTPDAEIIDMVKDYWKAEWVELDWDHAALKKLGLEDVDESLQEAEGVKSSGEGHQFYRSPHAVSNSGDRIFVNAEGDLEIRVSADTQKFLSQQRRADESYFQSDRGMHDVLDGFLENSEFGWGTPDEIGALTDAPIIVTRGEDGEPVKAWGFMDYALRSPQDDLIDKGGAVFQSGGEGEGGGVEEAKDDKPVKNKEVGGLHRKTWSKDPKVAAKAADRLRKYLYQPGGGQKMGEGAVGDFEDIGEYFGSALDALEWVEGKLKSGTSRVPGTRRMDVYDVVEWAEAVIEGGGASQEAKVLLSKVKAIMKGEGGQKMEGIEQG